MDSYLQPADLLADLKVDFRPETTVAELDRRARALRTAQGEALTYDKLVLATGCRARPLPIAGAELPGVRRLRTIEDSLAIAAALREGLQVVVIGGGWIGLEVASAAVARQASVTLVEAADRLCARAVPPALSHYLAELHRRHGVRICLEAAVAEIRPADNSRQPKLSVVLEEGDDLAADMVVVGVGALANDELACASGLACAEGIVTDEAGRTADPRVFACGDVSRYAHPAWGGQEVRLESWANARDQAVRCAHAVLQRPVPAVEPPWFWSDQHGVNIQIVGCPSGEPPVRRPASIDRDEDDRFSLFWLSDGRLAAAASMNQPLDVKLAKRSISAHARVEAEELSDPTANLRSLLKRRD